MIGTYIEVISNYFRDQSELKQLNKPVNDVAACQRLQDQSDGGRCFLMPPAQGLLRSQTCSSCSVA